MRVEEEDKRLGLVRLLLLQQEQYVCDSYSMYMYKIKIGWLIDWFHVLEPFFIKPRDLVLGVYASADGPFPSTSPRHFPLSKRERAHSTRSFPVESFASPSLPP